MPYGDVAESARALDAQYGADASSVMPSDNDFALFTGNPYEDGVETDYPSYARATVNNADWPDADPALATKTLTVNFPDATAPVDDDWSVVDDITAWVMFNGSAIVAWEFLDTALELEAVGPVSVDVVLYNPNDENVTG